jgi:holliday junction DNA helicase RuvA
VIGSLRGRLLHRADTEVLVEVGGLGYRVTLTPSSAATVGEVGAEVFLHVHHHVREDGETLFGFRTVDERLTFEALLGAHGVGPSLALAIVAVHPPDALRRVVATDDVAALCLVPGVGKKTAARLLLELKSRLDVPEGGSVAVTVVPPDGSPASALADVREALVGLGYGADEIREAVADLPTDGDTASAELLRAALRRLAGAR